MALRGTQFGNDSTRVQVTVGGRPATVASVAPQEVVIAVPEGAQTGRVAITVNGVGPVESSADLTVLVPVTVTRVEPRTGDVGDAGHEVIEEAVAAALHPKLAGHRVFLCGDPERVQALRKQCFLRGARMNQILADAFVTAPPPA